MRAIIKVATQVQRGQLSYSVSIEDNIMKNMTTRQTISALVAMPILLMAQTTQCLASISAMTGSPIKPVLVGGDGMNSENLHSQFIAVEESENWDLPNFSEDGNIQTTKIKQSPVKSEITSPETKLYISAARGRSSRSCRISGLC
ncbi:hypothetical protein [Microcoleus sp. CAWBG640]